MTVLQPLRSLNSAQRRAYTACFLGWTLDAFDFFLLTFCLDAIAATFHVSLATAAKAIFWTLLMRPVGALVFGALAEKFGRRPTLMLNVVSYSVFVMASAFAPTFGWFLAMRALFGVAMGGEWGVGAALALESLPAEGRGFFSGLLQEGYVMGSMLAALVYLLFPYLHGTGMFTAWRVLFLIGAVPSLLLLLLLRKVDESPAWLAQRQAAKLKAKEAKRSRVVEVLKYLPSLLALTVLMTAFMAFSHGTQDLYPTFLKVDHGIRGVALSTIAIVGNVGAVFGGIWFGSYSERVGRRRAIITAALLSIPMIPLWAWSHTAVMLAVGGFLMQFMVQGAWGVIPVHLNEMSPPAVRAIFPGLAYQLGNVLSSRNSVLQAAAATKYFGGRFAPVLAITVVIVAVIVVVVTALGREAKGADLSTL
ncbi:MFS transporter [Granulicella sp. L46]|uniref:MFS transporter n=1 Tax=Granulicella sp. L46 TaxID=1641865 RepID=UPI00131B5776|nr:MFS transporter [Granulicella sp. L46]